MKDKIIFGIYKTSFSTVSVLFAEKEIWKKTKDFCNSMILPGEELGEYLDELLRYGELRIPGGMVWGGSFILEYYISDEDSDKIRISFENQGFEYSEEFSKAIKDNKFVVNYLENS